MITSQINSPFFTFISMRVPTKWSDISIEKYFAINERLKKGGKELDKQIGLLSIVTGRSEELINKIKYKQFGKIIKKLKFLETLNIPESVPRSFWLKGIKYKFKPNLNHFTAENLIDAMSYGKDGEYKNMHKVLALYCKPVRWQFWVRQKNAERADIFYRNMSVATALPTYVFFSNVLRDLLPRIETYLGKMLNKEMKTIAKMAKELSRDTGVGSSPLTDSATVIPQNGTPS